MKGDLPSQIECHQHQSRIHFGDRRLEILFHRNYSNILHNDVNKFLLKEILSLDIYGFILNSIGILTFFLQRSKITELPNEQRKDF